MIDKKKLKSNIRFLIGGVCAALVPVMIGFILLAIPIIAETDSSCNYRNFHSNNVSSVCGIYQEFGSEFYWFIMLPIILSFIFVAPLVAAMSITDLQDQKPLTWSDIFQTSMAKSTKANFWVAAAYNAVICLTVIIAAIGTSGAGNTLGILTAMIVYVALVQFGLWIFITIPLALFCAAIFGLIVRPNSDFIHRSQK